MIIAVVIIIAVVVVYLVSTIVALQKITRSLNDAIEGVTGSSRRAPPSRRSSRTSTGTSMRASIYSRACS